MKPMFKAAVLLAAAAALAPISAQTSSAQSQSSAEADASAQEKISRLVVYGNDPCPHAEDQIVVCARRPESERYRIPKALRDTDTEAGDSTSWGMRAQSLEYAGRTGTQSCSPVGPGGFTGCWDQMMRVAHTEHPTNLVPR
ncbi:MAG: hypothetical protein E6G94_07250 [Alphaproteobacteria bacterium]|nr:MAG: hypothetical protein E6G94_07250 [Alphaproteobacteria bacterium]